MTLTIEVYEADNSTLVDVIDPGQFKSVRGSHVPLNGFGNMVLQRTLDGVANPALVLIEHQRLIRFTDDHDDPEADPFVWTMEIEVVVDVPLSDQEEAGETVTVSGRDWLSARMDKVHVLPDVGLGNLPWDPTRCFDYSADRLRDDDIAGPQGIWDFAVATDPDYDAASPMHGRSKGYVDTLAEHLWFEDVSSLTDAGDDYFRQRSEFPGGAVYFELGADDFAELKFDNVALLRVEKVYVGGSVHCIVDNVSAGEHLIAVKGTNANALKAFVKASWWTVSSGMPDELIGSLNETECRNLPYPADPPGFTPPEVIRLVVDEQQDIGRLTGVGFSFLSASDTADAAVTEVTDLTAKAPADTLLTLLKKLSATYLDIDGDPIGGTDAEANPCDLLIHAWIRGTAGNDVSGSTIFEKGTARNISHEARSNEKATVALVSGNKFAPFQYPTVAPAGEIYEVSLDFGDASKATATRFAAEYVELVDAVGRSGITLDLVSSGPKPGKDFAVWDTVGVLESDGSIGDHRVTGIAFDLDAGSVVRYSADLDQPSQAMEERLSLLMRMIMPGTTGGRVITPSPVSPEGVTQKDGDEEAAHKWQWDGPLGEIQFYKNGTAITGATIDASDLTSPGDSKRTTLTGNGAGATSRRFTLNSDKIQMNAGGGGLSPSWVPTDGRWLQEVRATVSDDGETIVISLMVAKH